MLFSTWDSKTFAPLRSQNFRKKSPDFFAKMKFSFSFSFSFLQNLMNFVLFLLNFNEILSEFHEELQKIAVILDIFTKLPEKFGKMLEISGFCEEFHSSVSLFSIHSLLKNARRSWAQVLEGRRERSRPLSSVAGGPSLRPLPSSRLKSNDE